jgi:outer membrane autotransporter protein
LSPGQLTPQTAPVAVTPALDAITEHQNTLPGATDGPGVLSRGAGAGSDGQQGALWGQLLAGNATRDQSNGAAGYGATTYGVLAGADFEVTPELLAGVAIDWITSRVTGNDALAGSNTRLSSYQFEGYGSWRPDRFDGRLTVDGQLGFGENSYNQHRAISYLNLGANAHFDGQQYVASVLAGYRLDIQGPVEVAPYLRLRETHLVNGGYSETGAGLADLAVNGITTDSFTHELGVKAGMEFDTQFGKMFPAVKVGWIHDYTNGPIALTGNLLGGTVFTSATSQPGADGAALGLTLDLKRTDSFSLSIEYDGEYHKDFTSNTGLVNGTWKF